MGEQAAKRRLSFEEVAEYPKRQRSSRDGDCPGINERRLPSITQLLNHDSTPTAPNSSRSSQARAMDNANDDNFQSRGHTYGDTDVAGNSTLQQGDQFHENYGHTSFALSVTGNVTVNNRQNAFAQDSPEMLLKKKLYYEEMDARKAQLDLVTPASLEWIWTDTAFEDWLGNDAPIFWICGKPGSGKSTMINHLITKDRGRLLRTAKQFGDLLIVHFFFDFRADKNTANTIIGLLRTFLIQLLETSQTARHYLWDKCGFRGQASSWPDRLPELVALFCQAAAQEHKNLYIFVDGLDEYMGDMSELIDTLSHIQEQCSAKLCLASRPDPALSRKLGDPNFKLEHRNAPTISVFVSGSLADLQKMLESSGIALKSNQVELLRYSILQRASGVFLWVKLIIQLLSESLLSAQRFETAAALLETLPQDLNQLYRRIFDRLKGYELQHLLALVFAVRHQHSELIQNNLGSLMTAYSYLMREIHRHSMEFQSEQDVSRFYLFVRNRAGCLLDFGHNYPRVYDDAIEAQVRLNHEMLAAFLDSYEPYQDLVGLISQHVAPRNFTHWVLNLAASSVAQCIDLATFDFTVDPFETARELAQAPRVNDAPPSAYTRVDILYALSLCFEDRRRSTLIESHPVGQKLSGPILDTERIELVLSILSTSLVRYSNYRYSQGLDPIMSDDVTKFARAHFPEIEHLVRARQRVLLGYLINKNAALFSDTIRTELFGALRQRESEDDSSRGLSRLQVAEEKHVIPAPQRVMLAPVDIQVVRRTEVATRLHNETFERWSVSRSLAAYLAQDKPRLSVQP